MPISTKTMPDGSNQFLPADLRLEAAAASHAGQVRDANEDVFGIFADEKLFVVADGMGGRAAGEVAARIAVDVVESFCRDNHASPPESWPFPLDLRHSRTVNLLRVALKLANRQILESARGNPAWFRMGATIAVLTFDEDHLVAAHAGDVRVYRMRNGSIARLTRDHSVAEEMRSARPDMPEKEIAALVNRNVITRALGSRPEIEPTVYLNRFADGDLYLLASDGLWGCVPDDSLRSIIEAQPDLELACQALIDAANQAGAPDNATAVLVRVRR